MKTACSTALFRRASAGLALCLWLPLAQGNAHAATTCDEWVSQGRTNLAAHSLTNANFCFSNAVAQCPGHEAGNVFYAATRLLTLPDQPAGKALLDRLGVAPTNRSVFGWTADLPHDTNGAPLAPAAMSAAEITAFVRANVLTELIGAAGNLRQVTNTNFTLALASNETSTVAVTLDYGDVLLLRAGIQFAQFAAYAIHSWDFDFQLAALRSWLVDGTLTTEHLLAQHPELFTFATTNDLALARQAFAGGVALYLSASEFIRGRTNVTRLFNDDPEAADVEAEFRTTLADLKLSLGGPVVLTLAPDYTVCLSNLFSGASAPRAFFPAFANDAVIAGTLPDATFGGAFTGFAPHEVESLLGYTTLDSQPQPYHKFLPFVSRFRLPQQLPDRSLQITLDALEHSLFRIQVSTNLQTWADLTNAFVHSGKVSFRESQDSGSTHRFYRALDLSDAFSVSGTVFDVPSGNVIPHAQVILSFPNDPLLPAITNYADAAGNYLLISTLQPAWGEFQLTVSRSGYETVQFTDWYSDWPHLSIPVYLAAPGWRPENDDFPGALWMGTNLAAIAYNVGATREPLEPYLRSGRSVWWTWTAPADGAVTLDAIGSSCETLLTVFTGDSVSGLTQVAQCRYTPGDENSGVDFFVTAGTTYRIAEDTYPVGGFIALHLRYTPPRPPAITYQPKSQTVTEDAPAGFSVSVAGTLPLFCQWRKDGAVLPGATERFYQVPRAQTNDAGGYTVVVSNAAGSVTSAPPAILTVYVPPPPANDAFANRVFITGASNTLAGSNAGASKELGEPDHAGDLGGSSVWWNWVAPADGQVTIDTMGSSFDTVLAVYTGDSVSNLALVAADDLGGGSYSASKLTFFTAAGSSYHIAVDGYAGVSGNIVLHLQQTCGISCTVFKQVAAGYTHAIAVGADGTLWAWGRNSWGQLGIGTWGSAYSPVQIGRATNWQLAAAGVYHTAAVKTDGTLWAWGKNSYGQLGDGTTTHRSSPVQVGTATNWQSVSAGDSHTVAVRTDGTLWAWGYNYSGQLGDGTATNRSNPVQIGLATNWKSAVAGSYHTVALRKDGTLWAWGDNGSGQLGDGTWVRKYSPVQIGSAANWQSVSAGYSHTLAVRTDGALWAWGNNAYGQLGDTTTQARNTPLRIGSATNWQTPAAGRWHTLAVRTDGTLWAWGYNVDGRLGDGTTTNRLSPVQVGSATNWQSVAVGEVHTVALRTEGTLWTWGHNGEGQLGSGATASKYTPVQIGAAVYWQSVATRSSYTVAIGTNGTLWGWGYNVYGQLGDGTATDRFIPLQIGSATNWQSVSAGYYHTVAVRAGGTLWAWGYNGYGQLGDGTTTSRSSPAQVGTAVNCQSVSAGCYHTVAVRADGTLWAWGNNSYGQLGDGTTTNRSSPVQIGSATNWQSVSVGYYHTVAIRADGTLWAWGYNYYGQLGDGTTTNMFSPVQVGTAANWKSVAAGEYHTVAIRTDGTFWAWGYNGNGQLGDGTTASKYTPLQMGLATNWQSVSAGSAHTVAVRTDGTLWGWGSNYDGQLGNWRTSSRYTPARIGSATNWQSAAAGSWHTLAVRTDGRLWAWGDNRYGQLGDGTTIRTTPGRVGAPTAQ